MSVDVSIIVVSYNTRDMTLACLKSVYAETREASFELIVVDNASSDGSADAIAESFPQARLVRLEENVGFAGGNNLAAERAEGDYLLLLNPDTVILRGAIDRLMRFARERPEHRIYGGRTLFADGSLNPTSCWGRPTLWRAFCQASGLTAIFRGSPLFAGESLGSWRRDSVREVDVVTGCFLLIERSLWERLGGFDLSFFMYGEEVDLCLRAARDHEARPVICPEAELVHYGGASEKVRSAKMVRLFSAKARLMRKHWTGAASRLGVGTLGLWCVSRWVAHRAMSLASGGDRRARNLESARSWGEVWRQRREWIRAGREGSAAS